ncbi:MAG: hypothetical protein U0Z53_28865 [Blastocatellia bacterium]
MREITRHNLGSSLRAHWREACGAVRARWRLAGLLFLLAMLTGTALLLYRHPTFEASMKILVSAESDAAAATAPGPAQATSQVSTEEFNSELEIIGSRDVLAQVAGEMSAQNPTEKNFDLSRLRIAPVTGSHIITVSFRDEQPQRATAVLNALFEQYAAHRRRLAAPPSQLAALREQSAAYESRLTAATEALRQFDARHELLSAGTQKELLLRQFYDLQSQANAARTEKQALEQRFTVLKSQLAAQPEHVETSSVTKYAQSLDRLKNELTTLELQRTQMLRQYQPEHRLMRDLEQRLAQIRELIAREEQHPPRERSVALNETRRRLADELIETESSLAALAEREKELARLLRQAQAQLSRLDQQGYQKNDLERERVLNEEAWVLSQRQTQQAELRQALNQGGRLRVSVAEAARLSAAPAGWPVRILSLVGGSLLAALVGVWLAEWHRPRIRSREGAQQRLRLTVLARIPSRRAA